MGEMSLDDDARRMMSANERNWDERAPIHAASEFYRRDADGWFADYEWTDLGPLDGRDLLHLQCHLGVETLAFARRGARVVGLDLSGESVGQARRIAAEAGLGIEYVQSNVYDALESLPDRRFDVVYTGKGSICYLPDLARWAEVVAGLLRPGGQVYVVEFHPLLNALGVVPPADGGEELLLRNDFMSRGVIERDATRTYTDGPALIGATVAYEWLHSAGDVLTALAAAGLRVDRLRESELLPWPRWSTMIPAGDWFRLPDDAPRIPLMYALHATRPA